MEVEEQDLPSPSRGSKRFSLNRSVQASFGSAGEPDFVFDIASSWDNSVMAVSLSTKAIKIYSPITGQFFGDCFGHKDTITDLLFPEQNTPHTFCSSSLDGSIRLWDSRICKQVSLLKSYQPSPAIYSFSFGGSSGNLVAAGCTAAVLCWDWRTRQQLACMEDCHAEDVTQVRFHPVKREKLFSACVDGLICVFDTRGEINDDEGLDIVMNVGTSVGRIGFHGASSERLWCLTHIETLSIWDFEEGTRLADFSDTRAKASANWALPPIDYLVQCHSSAASERLWLMAGTNAGSLGYFPVNYSKNQSNNSPNPGLIGPVSAVLEGGHSGIVRTVWSPLCHNGDSADMQGLFCWTGGEDGRLCSWSEGRTVSEKSAAWVSRKLFLRKYHQKQDRYRPY